MLLSKADIQIALAPYKDRVTWFDKSRVDIISLHGCRYAYSRDRKGNWCHVTLMPEHAVALEDQEHDLLEVKGIRLMLSEARIIH